MRDAIVNQDIQRQPSEAYAPSSMKCARNMFYKRSGYDTDPTPRSHNMIGITESGTDRHDRLQRQIHDAKDIIWVDVEEHIKENNLDHIQIKHREGMELQLYDIFNRISFRCDGIIDYQGKRYILEIKTETEGKWVDRKDVDPDHKAQAAVYSLILGIPEVMFLYENRNNCLKKAFVYAPTKEDENIVIERIKRAEVGFLLGQEPEAEPSSSNCRYCNYKMYCDAVNKR